MALEPAKLSDFTLAGALGSGATSRVYEATHTASGRPVAIKLMEVGAGDVVPSPHEMRERFAREALLLAGVESRYVSRILGYGFERGQPFLVLERLQGETLDAKLRRDGPVPLPMAVRWIEQLIAGVRDCHDAKIIHRDIKPSNIFIHRDPLEGEVVKLIDFGVARLREITGDTGLTSTSHLIGSMGYMAPEQFKSAKTVGFAADLYAVGVVVFRTLTGRLPFVSRSIDAIVRMKSEAEPPAVSDQSPIKNRMLDWFVRKAMARDPEARFRSAREMLEQWWAVTQNLENEVTTEVMRSVRHLIGDASVASSRPHPAAPPSSRRITEPLPPPGVAERDAHLRAEHELALLRATAASASPTTPMAPPIVYVPAEAEAPLTEAEAPPTIRQISVAERDAPPRTVPSDRLMEETKVSSQPAKIAAEDPFDIPTRSDPNLRKLVERELELQKRKRRG